MVLEAKSLANISRCTLESADQSNLSRFLSAAPWLPDAVNQRRVAYLLSHPDHSMDIVPLELSIPQNLTRTSCCRENHDSTAIISYID
jgi:hypothetical protein